jgi:hypothetical protein
MSVPSTSADGDVVPLISHIDPGLSAKAGTSSSSYSSSESESRDVSSSIADKVMLGAIAKCSPEESIEGVLPFKCGVPICCRGSEDDDEQSFEVE